VKEQDSSSICTSRGTLEPVPPPSVRYRAVRDRHHQQGQGPWAESEDLGIPYLTQLGWLLSDASLSDVLVVSREGRVLLANERGRAFASRMTASGLASLLATGSVDPSAEFQTTPLARVAGVPTSYLLVRQDPTDIEHPLPSTAPHPEKGSRRHD